MNSFRRIAEHSGTRLQQLLFAGLLLGLLLLPWPLGSNRPWAVAAFVVYFSALAILWLLHNQRHAPGWPSHVLQVPLVLAMIWLLWVASYLLPAACAPIPGSAALAELGIQRSCRSAVDPDAHAQVLLRTVLYLEIGLLTLLLVTSVRRAYVLVGVLIASGALLGTLGTLAALVGTGFDADWVRIGAPGRASGPFVNPNHFAGYLELLLGLGIGALVGLLQDVDSERSWRQWLRDLLKLLLSARALLRMALVVLVVALVTTQSRSGNVAFLLAVLAGCVIGALAMPRPPRKLLLLGTSLLVVDLLIVSSWFGFDKLAQRVGITASAVVAAGEQNNNMLLGADAERTRVAQATLDLWREAPLRGHGGGGFRALFPAHRPADVSDRLYDHAHNDYAQLLAEFGLLGGLLAVGIVGGAVLCSIQAMRKRKRRNVQGLALGCLIALLALAIHSFTDFNLQIPANASLYTVVLALAWLCRHGFEPVTAKRTRVDRKSGTHRRQRRVAAIVFCLLPTIGSAATDFPGTCRSALAEPVVSIPIPNAAATPAADIRKARDAQPKNETLRAQAGEVAITTAMRALALTARGQGAPAAVLESDLRVHLHDTVWRVEQAVRSGRSDAAMALLLMVRIGMAEPTRVALSCAALSKAERSGATLWYETALCELHEQPGSAVEALQHAAQQGHVLAQESLGRLCLQASTPDPECALTWFCRAVSAGHHGAAAQAAWVLQQNDRSTDARGLIRTLYQRGAEAGDAVSANNLGELYETETSADLERAEHWYTRAAELGLEEAQLNLARLWLATASGARRRAQALKQLRTLQPRRPAEVEALVQRYQLRL